MYVLMCVCIYVCSLCVYGKLATLVRKQQLAPDVWGILGYEHQILTCGYKSYKNIDICYKICDINLMVLYVVFDVIWIR